MLQHTAEGELEAAGRGNLGRFCQEFGGEKEDETLCCLWWIPTFGMPVPTASFGRDEVTRGAEAGGMLATCLWEGACGDFGAAGKCGLLKAPKGTEGLGWGEEEGPVPWPYQPPVTPLGFLESKAMGEQRRRLLGLPSGAPVCIFMKCWKGKSNFIMA